MYIREPDNFYTHFIPALISIPAMFLLMRNANSDAIFVACLVYGLGAIALFFISSLYHAIPKTETAIAKWQKADHASIYVMIAGTYTPAIVVLLSGWVQLGFLIGIWVVAAIGVARKVFFKVKKRSLLSTMSYIFMGCSVFFVIDELYRNLPIEALYWLLGGGVFYIGGTYFYQANKPFISGVFGFHAIWHLCVFGGALCHYIFIYNYLV